MYIYVYIHIYVCTNALSFSMNNLLRVGTKEKLYMEIFIITS